MRNLIIIIALSLSILSSCTKPLVGYKFNRGSLPTSPVNLSDFNTEFDDYNSTAPSLGELIPFCFSTNRNSRGKQFDVIYKPMNVNFDKSSGKLKVTSQYANWSSRSKYYRPLQDGLIKIKTEGNEFGPNLIVEYGSDDEYDFTLMYSTDIGGNAQINFISNRTETKFSTPKEIAFLNSEFDDMYPTFNTDKTKIYFCSNRSNSTFDFYFVEVDPKKDIEHLLADTSAYVVNMDMNLSSDSNDKCPFILGNTMVFASDRAGGFGGYDLYYSRLENGKWSAPINFGEKINTASDEYRPILINEGVADDQTMMVFSSNRSEGLGGFDLYFVGIENQQ